VDGLLLLIRIGLLAKAYSGKHDRDYDGRKRKL
jgi:hypothetical protein